MAFRITRNDITNVKADAIVNTANPEPIYGNGVDRAIYEAAGAEYLLQERRRIGRLNPGQAAPTPAFGLNARYIIHTVGPVWIPEAADGTDRTEELETTLRSCYRNSMETADELGCESMAMPLISAGTNGFPKDRALQIAVTEISGFLMAHEMKITLVVLDQEAFVLSGQLFEGVEEYIDRKAAEKKLTQEYGTSVPGGREERGRKPENAAMPGALMQNAPGPGAPMPDMPMPGAPKPSESRLKGLFRRGKNRAAESTPFSPGILATPQQKPEAGGSFFSSVDGAMPNAFPEQGQTGELCEEADAAKEPLDQDEGVSILSDQMVSDQPVYGAAAFRPEAGKDTLEERMAHIADTWQEALFRWIDQKGFTDVEVYKRANVDRKLFSKIRSKEEYQPKKMTAVAFAIALELNLDETQDLLKRAGYALSQSNKFDLIIEYFIEHEVYDTYIINLALFEHKQPLLGE